MTHRNQCARRDVGVNATSVIAARAARAVVTASLLITGCGHAVPARTSEVRVATPSAPAVGGSDKPADAIGRINHAFHDAYEADRAREEASLGARRPFLVIRGGVATLHHQGKEMHRALLDERYHAVKGLTHISIAAVSLLSSLEATRPTEASAAPVRALRTSAEAAAREVPQAVADPALVTANRALLAITVALLDEALERGRPGDERLRTYGLAIRPHVIANLTEASRLHIEALDAAVREMEHAVGATAWSELVVLVTTAHQARAREVNVQYFERLLGERMGEGALGEQRLIVTEGPLERLSPGAFAASHLLDQRLSRLLFDDPMFLQSDVTGRFAAVHLQRVLAGRAAHGSVTARPEASF